MSFKKKENYTTVEQAKDHVIGFKNAFSLFEEHVVINQKSKALLVNYGRSIAYLALHFNRLPQDVSAEEINTYLYRISVHENHSLSYFKASRLKPKLKLLQMMMGVVKPKKEKADWKEISKTKMGFDVDACPCCKTGKMQRIMSFNAHAPPPTINNKLKPKTKQ